MKGVNKHRRVIQAIYDGQANIFWSDIEKMFIHLGAEVSEGRGSRVRIALNGVRAVFIGRTRKKKQIEAL